MIRNHYLVAVIIITARLDHIHIFLEGKKASNLGLWDGNLNLGLLFISLRLLIHKVEFETWKIWKGNSVNMCQGRKCELWMIMYWLHNMSGKRMLSASRRMWPSLGYIFARVKCPKLPGIRKKQALQLLWTLSGLWSAGD